VTVIPDEVYVGTPTYVDLSNEDSIVVGPPLHVDIITVTPPTGNNNYFLYNQTLPLATWTINHSFGRFPSVTVIDSTGFAIITDIEYPNNSMVVVTFAQPTTGKALLV
jgi:hypothetical protein